MASNIPSHLREKATYSSEVNVIITVVVCSRSFKFGKGNELFNPSGVGPLVFSARLVFSAYTHDLSYTGGGEYNYE